MRCRFSREIVYNAAEDALEHVLGNLDVFNLCHGGPFLSRDSPRVPCRLL